MLVAIPVRNGRLFALASVEIDIAGIILVIKGVRVFRYREPGRADDFAGLGLDSFAIRMVSGEMRFNFTKKSKLSLQTL